MPKVTIIGNTSSEISASMPNVAEGVATTAAVHQLAENHGLKLPIISLIYGILFEGLPPSQALIDFKELAASHH
jgi:glycerol-3-phosphate dehydrogenase (NAD(P)+)